MTKSKKATLNIKDPVRGDTQGVKEEHPNEYVP